MRCCMTSTQSFLHKNSGYRDPECKTTRGVRVPGFEPGLEAWEAPVLPLDYTRFGWVIPRRNINLTDAPGSKIKYRVAIGYG